MKGFNPSTTMREERCELRCARWLWGMLFFCGVMRGGAQVTNSNSSATIEITNVHQIRLLAAQISKASYSIHLEGEIWWAHSADGRFVLKDDSGAEELEMDLRGQVLSAGQRVRLAGNSAV